MRLLLVGPPGAGKGTQGTALGAALAVVHISSGALLRRAMLAERQEVSRLRASVAAGNLVPDDLMVTLLRERFRAADVERGYVLDGFPRTRAQIPLLATLDHRRPDAVVHLDVPDDVVVERARRRNRADDREAAVRTRLAEYARTTQPMIDELVATFTVVRVDSVGPVDEVTRTILGLLADLPSDRDPGVAARVPLEARAE